MRTIFPSVLSFLLGYVIAGVGYSAFDVYVAGHFDHLMLAQHATFELGVLVALVSGISSTVLFVLFSSLLRTLSPAVTSFLLGALSWCLFMGLATLHPLAVPSVGLVLVLLAVPLVSACLGRALAMWRVKAGAG